MQALQILTNDDEVENWSLSSFLLAVLIDCSSYKSINSGILLRWWYTHRIGHIIGCLVRQCCPNWPSLKFELTLLLHLWPVYYTVYRAKSWGTINNHTAIWIVPASKNTWIFRSACNYSHIKLLNVKPKLFSSCNGALKSPCIKLNSRVHFAAIKQENNFMKTFL